MTVLADYSPFATRHSPFAPRHSPFATHSPRHPLALLDRAVVAPQHARRDAAPGPPGLGERHELLLAGPRLEAESMARRLLQGEVAGREGIRMADAGHE